MPGPGPTIKEAAVDPVWADRAACRGVDPGLFVEPLSADRERDARAVCAGCDVRDDCLMHAISNREEGMMWGGETDDQRARTRRAMRRREAVRATGQLEMKL